jgi:hypothetical protein
MAALFAAMLTFGWLGATPSSRVNDPPLGHDSPREVGVLPRVPNM